MFFRRVLGCLVCWACGSFGVGCLSFVFAFGVLSQFIVVGFLFQFKAVGELGCWICPFRCLFFGPGIFDLFSEILSDLLSRFFNLTFLLRFFDLFGLNRPNLAFR